MQPFEEELIELYGLIARQRKEMAIQYGRDLAEIKAKAIKLWSNGEVQTEYPDDDPNDWPVTVE